MTYLLKIKMEFSMKFTLHQCYVYYGRKMLKTFFQKSLSIWVYDKKLQNT